MLAAEGTEHGWHSKQEHLSQAKPEYVDPKERTRFLTTVSVPGTPPKRKDRLPPKVFRGKAFLLRIRDVIKRHDQHEHSESDVYSNAEIIRRIGP